jgi:hypothetical protein
MIDFFQSVADNSRVHPALLLIGTVILIAAMLFLGKKYWRRRLTTWAESEGFELLEFRGAHAFEGPRAWRTSENQDVVRVSVRRRRGNEPVRSAWVVFGNYWNPFSRNVEVHWID